MCGYHEGSYLRKPPYLVHQHSSGSKTWLWAMKFRLGPRLPFQAQSILSVSLLVQVPFWQHRIQ